MPPETTHSLESVWKAIEAIRQSSHEERDESKQTQIKITTVEGKIDALTDTINSMQAHLNRPTDFKGWISIVLVISALAASLVGFALSTQGSRIGKIEGELEFNRQARYVEHYQRGRTDQRVEDMWEEKKKEER